MRGLRIVWSGRNAVRFQGNGEKEILVVGVGSSQVRILVEKAMRQEVFPVSRNKNFDRTDRFHVLTRSDLFNAR